MTERPLCTSDTVFKNRGIQRFSTVLEDKYILSVLNKQNNMISKNITEKFIIYLVFDKQITISKYKGNFETQIKNAFKIKKKQQLPAKSKCFPLHYSCFDHLLIK